MWCFSVELTCGYKRSPCQRQENKHCVITVDFVVGKKKQFKDNFGEKLVTHSRLNGAYI